MPADHPDKAKEIGSEPNPAAFLDTLLALTAEWGRVLAPWGSIAIELGDTYSGSGSPGGDYAEDGLRSGQPRTTYSSSRGAGWPNPKCLALIPQMYAGSLAYGRNLLTGEPSPAGQWLVRNMIVWHRPNPAVGALGDKVRPATSYITVATRSPKRWFDLSAVRGPLKVPAAATPAGARMNRAAVDHPGDSRTTLGAGGTRTDRPMMSNAAGAPPLDCWFDEHDVWTVTTQPSKIAHYAMWPPKLAERIVLSMCPAEVCRTCNEPRRRIEKTGVGTGLRHVGAASGDPSRGPGGDYGNPDKVRFHDSQPVTLGWTDCGHGDFTPGTVLDPFAGTGTTLCVADIHGRDSIGIDLDERNELLMPARYDEVKKSLHGTTPELTGQLGLDL